MLSNIIKAITSIIGTKFKNIPCHVSLIPDNAVLPCFFVVAKNVDITQINAQMFTFVLPVEVIYLTKKNEADNIDSLDVLDVAYELASLFFGSSIKNKQGNVFRLQNVKINNNVDEFKLYFEVYWQETMEVKTYDLMAEYDLKISN